MTGAIYIDFECLKGTPPPPALLGILVGNDGEDLQQVITDEHLAPASVANRERLVVSSAHDAVAEVMGLAAAHDMMIVGWSYFDRERMREACPELEAEIMARYVNALPIARRWRQKLHPHAVIEREDTHAAKHTLDKYAALAEYSHVRKLVDAAPAKWIRHTIRQLKAQGGYYRRTTSQTKRDWHKVLDYNRHDLLAVRHIFLKASRELDAWGAYERTRFCFWDSEFRLKAEATRNVRLKAETTRSGRGRTICFQIGSRSPRLAAALERHGAEEWAFITAWNPKSHPLSREKNDVRQAKLRRLVEKRGLTGLPGEGIGDDPAWTPEESLMVLGISEEDAIDLGRSFGQLAIVVGRRGGVPQLVPCT